MSYKQAEVIIQVPFHDVDVMEVVWHGHYAKYLEIARCQLFDNIHYNYPEMRESGYMWPVIDMRIRYPKPIRFRQKIKVRASIVEYEHRLKVNYEIFDAESMQRLTKAYTVQVAVDMSNGEMCFESPKILMEKLGISNV